MVLEELEQRKQQFLEELLACRPAFSAIGDETRQHILVAFIRSNSGVGLRVGEIQQETHLSRTAVSHHLKVMREAGILSMRREGTKNYYYLDPDSTSLKRLVRLWEQVEPLMHMCPIVSHKTEEQI